MPTSPEGFSLLKIGADILLVILAMLGGIARYLDSYIRTGTAPKFGLMVAHALVSGFSGFMVAQTMLQFTTSTNWALIGAGVGGYLGTQGLDWIAAVMRAHFVNQGGPNVQPPAPASHTQDTGKPTEDTIKPTDKTDV